MVGLLAAELDEGLLVARGFSQYVMAPVVSRARTSSE
jgi:hypothetical protein